MAETYYRASGNAFIHSVAQTVWGSGAVSGVIFPSWGAPDAQILVSGAINDTAVSGVPGPGYSSVCDDRASGVYALEWGKFLVRYDSSGVIARYPLPTEKELFAPFVGVVAL